MNTTKLSRRRLLAGVPAVAATMAPAAATVAGLALAPTAGLAATTTEVDPIFPLIERHRAAEAERVRLCECMWATYALIPESIRGRIGGKVDIGLFVSPSGQVRREAYTHDEIDLCLEQALHPLVHFAGGGSGNEETPDAFRARLAEAHAELDRDREMVERVHREAGCREAEAALEVADKVVEAAEGPLGAATATTWAGLLALVQYADEVSDEEVESNTYAEESMAIYLLPAIKRSLVGLV